MKKKFIMFSVIFMILIAPDFLYAAAGDLDTTFDTDGVVTYDRGAYDSWGHFTLYGAYEWFGEVAIQADGKIVIGATSFNGNDQDILVLRYNSDGTLDKTFGTGGVVTYDGGNHDYGGEVAIQADGKIVVGGTTGGTGTSHILVLRYNSDGTPDTAFDTDGVVTYEGGYDWGGEVAIQADGKIVVGGTSYIGLDEDILVLRYNSDGTPDNTFGTAGVVSYNGGDDEVIYHDMGDYDWGYDVAIQTDGKIVVGGTSFNGYEEIVDGTSIKHGDENISVLRYNSDGTLDKTFGTGGVVTYDGGQYERGGEVAIQADGKIVVSGTTGSGTNVNILVLRYNSDGTPDITFDTDGVVTYDGGNDDWGYDVAIQADGKIVVGGTSSNGNDEDISVLRYNSNGTHDNTFGTAGVVSYNGGDDDKGGVVAIQADDKIVIGGTTSLNGNDQDVLVLRLISKTKKCCIATAAYGSTTAAYGSNSEPHVMTLRKFRDKHLLTNKFGTKFVESYYKYSPPMADYISEHDGLKKIVRITLAPIVGFSWLALNYGIVLALTVLFSILVMIIVGSYLIIGRREAN